MFDREGAPRNPIKIDFISINMSIGMTIDVVGFGFISLDAIRRWMQTGRKKKRSMDEKSIPLLVLIDLAWAAFAVNKSTTTALSFIVQVQKLFPKTWKQLW